MSEPDNTVIDANTQTMRCNVCGDEVPIPMGALSWASTVMLAFAKEHKAPHHAGRRTWFSTPRTPAAEGKGEPGE